MAKEAKHTGEPGWSWRRAAIYPVVAWGCLQLNLLSDAADTRVNETIAEGWLWLIAVLVLGYTGFATIQDVAAIWRTGTGLPYRNPPAAAETIIVGGAQPGAAQP
jgi:hypothetical protein